MSDDAQTPGAPENGDPDPWAPPERRVPTAGAATPEPQDMAPRPRVPLDKPGAEPSGTPGPSSVHDQQTVTSLPGADIPNPPGTGMPSAPSPQPWANPVAPPAASAPGNPFAPPGGAQPGSAYPAPGGAYPAPGGMPPNTSGHSNPFAAPGAGGEPVPPPPISPDGPGQVPYGYGYPGQPYYPSAPGGGPGYGWPGMPMAPSNGLGTAGLVLGIIAAVGFCLWPLAIVVGILAVIFGAVGRGKARRGEATNPGQALAGIICGAVGIVLGVAVGVLVIVGPGLFGDDGSSDSGTGDDGFSTSLVTER
ncbi:DUF4190 domain-containing protein [Streptomyces montanus]|nr:DUF4190 domain-containing protein [Streptomyces montanus]